MAKKVFSNPAFQSAFSSGFNHIQTSNPFNSVFDIKPLDATEAMQIEKLLVDNFEEDTLSEKQVHADIEKLKSITADIKAIGRQGVVLIGERVHKARELLKPYRDGTFTKWLDATFGARKTGYNMLSYYELYRQIPDVEVKETFKRMPQRVAYVLASREGDIAKKIEIIQNSQQMDRSDLFLLINKAFPLSIRDKRVSKDSNSDLIRNMKALLMKLIYQRGDLTEKNKTDLIELKRLIDFSMGGYRS